MKHFFLLLSACFAANSLLAQEASEDIDYSNGTFIVNEDWYTHQNSSINWLSNDGEWTYRVFQKSNPGHELGATTQYGTIYGDKFFLISKQEKDPGAEIIGSRLAICGAKDMKLIKEFRTIATNENGVSIADGRSFLPVSLHKGYIGTSNGIWLFDMEKMEIGKQIQGSENPNTEGYGQLYHAQIGTMIRKDEYVYAVHQEKGLLIINAETDKIERVLQAPKENNIQRGFGSIVMSKDGNLWLSVCYDQSGSGNTAPYLLKYDTALQDTTRINVPEGIFPPSNSWYAWTPDGFCSSQQENALYWNGGPNSWFSNYTIIKYDIDNDLFSTFIDLEDTDWRIYGCSFRIHPETDEAYVSLFHEFGIPTYVLRKYRNDGSLLAEYPMVDHYWFPSLPVFPDKFAPKVNELPEQKFGFEPFVISLKDIATDDDNSKTAIVKTINHISHPEILDAIIKQGDLYVTPKGNEGYSDITIKINSNGRLAETTISVHISSNFTSMQSQPLAQYIYLENKMLNFINYEGFQFIISDINGRQHDCISISTNQEQVTTTLQAGSYILKGTKQGKVVRHKFMVR